MKQRISQNSHQGTTTVSNNIFFMSKSILLFGLAL